MASRFRVCKHFLVHLTSSFDVAKSKCNFSAAVLLSKHSPHWVFLPSWSSVFLHCLKFNTLLLSCLSSASLIIPLWTPSLAFSPHRMSECWAVCTFSFPPILEIVPTWTLYTGVMVTKLGFKVNSSKCRLCHLPAVWVRKVIQLLSLSLSIHL